MKNGAMMCTLVEVPLARSLIVRMTSIRPRRRDACSRKRPYSSMRPRWR